MVQKKIYMTMAASDVGLGYTTEGITLSGTQYSEPWSGKDADGAALHLEWTGTPTCNVTLWVSDKENPDRTSDTDWVQDTAFATAGTLALGGAAGKYATTSGNSKHRWKRTKSVLTAGAGTIKGWVTIPRMR